MFNKTNPSYFDEGPWTFEKTEHAVIGLCKILDRYAHKLTLDDLQNDPRCAKIPNLSLNTVQHVIDDTEAKLRRGIKPIENEVIYHTGPHHDDIMLGIMPFINRQMRSPSNQVHFAIMTSGYHSVTDEFLLKALEDTLNFDNVARKNPTEMRRGFCHRILRDAVELWQLKSVAEVENRFETEIENLRNGKANSQEINKLKGEVREFEEELVWAYGGTSLNHVHHLRLGLYNETKTHEPAEGPTIWTPDHERDVMPILNQLRELKPTVITVAIDYEGLGPNTHYKVMQSIAEAVRLWNEETNLMDLRIFGYRNVWSTFHPVEANVYVPVSLNAIAVFEKAFNDSYLTQVKAEFPNPDFDGPFSELAEQIWVKQLKDIQLVLGKNYFYENQHPLIRATHGLLFLKQMTASEFVAYADTMKSNM